MKYLLFVGILLALIITAGCTTKPIDTTVTQTSTQTPPITITTTELQTTITSSIPSISPTPSVTIPERVEDLNEQNQCQVMVACGKAASNGTCVNNMEIDKVKTGDSWCIIAAGYNPDPVCQKAVWMNTYIKTCMQSNPYEAAGNTGVECVHCMQGVGVLEDCLKIASKCEISRDGMKSMYCRTNSC